MLNRHPQVLCHYEIANPSAVLGPMWNQQRLTLEQRGADPNRFVADAFSAPEGKTAVGFKIFFGDSQPIVDQIMADSGVAKIFISRDNLLAAFSSQEIALATNKWGARTAEDLENVQVEFVVQRFEHYREYSTDSYLMMKDLVAHRGNQILNISYMRLHDPIQKAEIFRFIGLSQPKDAGFDSLKQNGSDIMNRFSNPDLVIEHLHRIGHPDWANEYLT